MMAAQAWRSDWRTALPSVFYLRWWLYRLATVAVVMGFGAAAMVPPPADCSIWHGITVFRALSPCDPSWHMGLRLELAATGVIAGLILAFVGARLDQLALRHRATRRRRLNSLTGAHR